MPTTQEDDGHAELLAPGPKQTVVTGMRDLQDVSTDLRGNPAAVGRRLELPPDRLSQLREAPP